MCPVRRVALRSISCKDILKDLKLLCKSVFPSPTERLFSCSRKCQSRLETKRSWPLGTGSYWAVLVALCNSGNYLQPCRVEFDSYMSCLKSTYQSTVYRDTGNRRRISTRRETTGRRHACYITLQLSILNKTQQFKSAGSDCLVRELIVNPGFRSNMTQVLPLCQVGCGP